MKGKTRKTPSRGLAALEVFLGGGCYGANATAYKLAYAAGFSWAQVVAAQMWFAAILFGFIGILGAVFAGKRWVALSFSQVLRMLALGTLTCVTSILYCFAMSRLPVAVALTLLFQFTWLGLVVQVAMTRRAPHFFELVAVFVILVGTVFASGIYKVGFSGLDPFGLVCAFLAAVSCALFITLSGKVQAPCPSSQRGFFVCLGAALVSLLVCPDFLISGIIFDGMAPFGFITGFFGMLLPVLLFGLGAPHLPAGVSSIMASAELPAGLFVSLLVLGEPIGLAQWAGVLLILLGVVVAQYGESLTAKATGRFLRDKGV